VIPPTKTPSDQSTFLVEFDGCGAAWNLFSERFPRTVHLLFLPRHYLSGILFGS